MESAIFAQAMELPETSSDAVEDIVTCPALPDGEKTVPASVAMSSVASSTMLATAENNVKPPTTEEKKASDGGLAKTGSSEKKPEFDPKSLRGWPVKPPFREHPITNLPRGPGGDDKQIYWEDLTWKQQLVWRKLFLQEYLSEAKRCLPYVRKLFLLIYRLSPWRTIVLVLANTLRGFIPALTLQTRGTFILMLQEGLQKKSLNKRELARLLLQELLSSVLEKLSSHVMSNVNVVLNARLQKELKLGVFKGFLELSSSEMTTRSTELYFRLARETYAHEDPMNLITNKIDILREAMSIVARVAALSSLTNQHSWPVLAFCLSIPVFDQLFKMIPWRKYSKDEWIAQATSDDWALQADAYNLERIGMSHGARPELTIFGAKEWLVKRYSTALDLVSKVSETGRLEYHPEREPFFHENIYPLLHGAARAIMYLAVAFQPDYFQMSIPQVTFLESSVSDLVSTVASLGDIISNRLVGDIFKMRNLFECMEVKSKENASGNFAPYIPQPKGMKIELKDVSFRYQKNSPLVLKNLSFTIQPGEIVSIVGYNGSGIQPVSFRIIDQGKTTLVRLLTMIDKPSAGEILINDRNISEYGQNVLYASMSVLFQDFRRFVALTAKENIGIGRTASMNYLGEIRTAAIQSGADGQVREYDDYYETRLHMKAEDIFYDFDELRFNSEDPNGEQPFMSRILMRRLYDGAKFEGKRILWDAKPNPNKVIDITIPKDRPVKTPESKTYRDLSGGQWQRIALARAFMKIKEADLLLLDEPSSALDPQAEYEVFKTIMELRKGRTTIYILFENGELVEMGTHDELLQIEKGKYAHLFRLQSEGYNEFNKQKEKVEMPEARPVGI